MEAARFAARLLIDHGQEGNFEVTLPSIEECDKIADRLSKLGCIVTINRYKSTLEVTCPPDSSELPTGVIEQSGGLAENSSLHQLPTIGHHSAAAA